MHQISGVPIARRSNSSSVTSAVTADAATNAKSWERLRPPLQACPDPMRTHVSDAVGCLVAREFSMRPVRGEMGGPAIC